MIKIPFIESLKRSIIYMLTNMDLFIKITSAWFLLLIVEALCGFPFLNSSTLDAQGDSLSSFVSATIIALAGVIVSVNYYRAIILREKKKYFTISFGKRELLYILYSILYVTIIAVPTLLLIFVCVFIIKLFALPAVVVHYLTLLPIIVGIIASRTVLVFPAISIDNKDLRMLASFKILKGNALKMFFGPFLFALPITLLLILISNIKQSVGDNFIYSLMLSAVALFATLFDTAIKATFFAHIYQYTMHFLKENSIDDMQE